MVSHGVEWWCMVLHGVADEINSCKLFGTDDGKLAKLGQDEPFLARRGVMRENAGAMPPAAFV
jgi:hypothetical protein